MPASPPPSRRHALQGLLAANRAGNPMLAYDQYISAGRLASYVCSDKRQAGRLVLVEYPMVSSTVEPLGGSQAGQALLPSFPVTRETLAHYPGWQGPLPAGFTKPWPSTQPEWQGQPREVRP